MLDKRFQTLIVVSETLSFTATARKLFITQPAVSQQIYSLEDELNLKLVDSTNHKISLTNEGKKLAAYCKQVEIEGGRIIDILQQTDNSNPFKMGCTLSLSSILLPKFIHHLAGKSKVLTTKINNTEHILQDIRDGKVDFGLIEGNFNKDEFDSIFIQNENFICVANPHLRISKYIIEELFSQNIFVREPGSGSREIFEHWLGTQNHQISDFQHIVEIASPNVIIQLLKQSPGISFIYESLVKTELENGQLKKLDLKGLSIEHPIHLVFSKNSYFTDTYQQLVSSVLHQ
ncbi:LysR family transcriptional regulator [Companilactobacillus ginsenosidimutans]|uniref:Transcriptional regulator n=1 Tax=Companilactobacillus ginsenosidimutans TaxID=1007676 RepID=A0A0H4R0X4_9LACO|nr:LysR family transcriptional regulator [Companilactobacillus ginsenosidimutans]AKP67375.1 transcriptional regulator [Companilactobacillus ginsenosidimutans]